MLYERLYCECMPPNNNRCIIETDEKRKPKRLRVKGFCCECSDNAIMLKSKSIIPITFETMMKLKIRETK